MTDQVITVPPETDILEIEQLFASHHFHHLPVVDRAGKLHGMISRLDYYQTDQITFKSQINKRPIENYHTTICAKDIMSDKVAYIGPEDPIEEATRVFLDNLMHALPVLDSGRVVGIITTFDILKHYSEKRPLLS